MLASTRPRLTAESRPSDEIEFFERSRRLEILQHAIGANQFGRYERSCHRNYFVTGEGSTDHPDCLALVELGFMTRTPGNAITGGGDVFRVTRGGMTYVAENSRTPPKLTRSQRRYLEWLDADSVFTFGEWLKNGYGEYA